jgi:preprotein translocase subunit SecF
VEQDKLLEVLQPLGINLAQIEPTEKEAFLIRTRTLGQEPLRDEQGNLVAPSQREQLDKALREKFGSFGLFDLTSVSPIIATEIGRNAAIAVAVAAVGILLYLAWAFRRMPQPFRYGTCAIIALVHDVLVMLGIFAIFGKLANVEINALFVTGVLAIIGYSVNDTVVVFDRIRENISKGISPDFETAVNFSLVQTLGRSLNTSLTTLFVVLAIFLLGGPTIHKFILVLLIGVISGTYSSIFIASPLLVVWEKGEWGRFLPRLQKNA